MAAPIPLKKDSPDPERQIRARLEQAPIVHAKAILKAYELLQQLDDHGVLDTLRGLTSAGGDVITHIAEIAITPESIRAARNLMSLAKILGSIDPELLGNLAKEVSGNPPRKLPGFFASLVKLGSKDSRRAWGALAYGVETFGRALARGGSK